MNQIQIERRKAQELRRSSWWKEKLLLGRCYYCNDEVGKEATMDHVVPLAQGGKSSKGNIVVCCKSCNTEKRSMTAVEWMLEKGL